MIEFLILLIFWKKVFFGKITNDVFVEGFEHFTWGRFFPIGWGHSQKGVVVKLKINKNTIFASQHPDNWISDRNSDGDYSDAISLLSKEVW